MSAGDVLPHQVLPPSFGTQGSHTPVPTIPSSIDSQVQDHIEANQPPEDAEMEGGEDTAGTPRQRETPPPTIPAVSSFHEDFQHESDSDGEEDEEDEEDSTPGSRWEAIEEDKSKPCDDETAYIENKGEHSALDHTYWEEQTFIELDDPELVPGTSGRIEWLVEHFNGTKENPNKDLVMRSQKVRMGEYEWQIKLYPHGNGGDYLSVYVECVDMLQPEFDAFEEFKQLPVPNLKGAPSLKKRRWLAAQVSVVMYNPAEPRTNEFKCDAHSFHKGSPDLGWKYFSYEPRYCFHQRRHGQREAILRDDKLAFTAHIRLIDDPTGCMWNQGVSSPEDSISVTGLRPFRGQSAFNAGMIPLLHLKQFREFIGRIEKSDAKLVLKLQYLIHKMLSRKPPKRHSRHDVRAVPIADCVMFLQSMRQKLHDAGLGKDFDGLFGPMKRGMVSDRLQKNSSVQAAIDSHTKLDTPPVLSLELERQQFTEQRKWKKLDYKIDLNDVVTVRGHSYTLYGFVTHTGHLQSEIYTAYVRPRGRDTRWYCYDGGRVRCLTRKQALECANGSQNRSGDEHDSLVSPGLDELVYLVYYVRDDQPIEVPAEEELASHMMPKEKQKVEKDVQGQQTTSGNPTAATATATATENESLIANQQTAEIQQPRRIVIDYFSREYFDGFYLNDKPHGEGHLISVQGDNYTGAFFNGQYHGKGKMIYAKDGRVYEGDWVDGKRHGQGVLTEENRRYEGGWHEDQQKGKFVLTGEVTDDEKSCCQICYMNPLNCALYDCGHVVACKDCARRIDDCPVCRKRVLARVELFGVTVSLE
ncbi:cysteine proteinase [Polychaeton citri CBS 116435]|uniref:Cysteine proteinase n=1 Tax=Polychaeton citri CBS 116435 TaxID=1314669 RepID=A0A9P4ULB7_9PEZI|nr:cysteine proteinase [Polychaeton citri CBS 116435]